MERLKLIIAIGLCVALMMFPLAGFAGNPLPTNDEMDGHPWDDGDQSSEPDDPADTLVDEDAEVAPNDPDLGNAEKSATVHFFTFGKWYLLLIW